MTEPKPRRRHPNTAEKRALKAAWVHSFMQQYTRKAHKGFDPNDRRYDRETEKAVQRMKPERLDQLLRDDEE